MRHLIAVGLVVLSGAAQSQSIASRVSAVRTGEVRMEYPSRVGVCGDGRDVIAFRNSYFSRDMESWGGRWDNSGCKPGPVRVSLTMQDGAITYARMQVGGIWRASDAPVTDLGVVSPREASAYFFSIAEKLDNVSFKQRPLMPAVLAADAEVIAPLRALANDDRRSIPLRRQAVQWLGLAGDASVVPDLVRLAKAGDAGEKKSLSNSAIAALAALDSDAGVAALLDLSRDASSNVRHDVVFWLGQVDDPRAVRRLRQVVDDKNEENRVRKNAIFALSQSEAAATKELITIYKTVEESSLKEQAIFALSQRRDDQAVESLLSIAKEDSDKRMRGKAMFWLAQKHDPRVTKLLTDILVH